MHCVHYIRIINAGGIVHSKAPIQEIERYRLAWQELPQQYV